MSGDVASIPRVLVIEPQFVLRRTIVEVARTLGVARLHEAASSEAALPLLVASVFDGLVLNIGTGTAALQLLTRLREAGFASAPALPVVALIAEADAAIDAKLQVLHVDAALHKPFKVSELLQWIERMTKKKNAR